MSICLKQSFVPDGWASFNADLFREYISDELKFRELCKISRVCKSWLKIITHNNTGFNHCKFNGGQIIKENSWMSKYRKFFSVPQIIALDVSGSMTRFNKNAKMKREDIAIDMIKKLVGRIEEIFDYRGIICIAFDNLISMKKCHNPGEIINFFIKDYKYKKYLKSKKGRRGSTDINRLFSKLHDIHKETQIKNPGLVCQATIISDFIDMGMKLEFLTQRQVKLHIQCLDVGEDSNLGNILEEYEKWIPEEVKWQHENIIPKKRKQDAAFSRDYEIPLNLVNVDLDSWEPVQKKRKIVIS